MTDRQTTTEVLVIGGGITGVGVARDLARRGVDVTLVERDTLAAGATGGMHGLLHSGARYALAEPESARQCRAENAVLREIAPHAISETGGLFLARAEDPAGHVDERLAACRSCEIPVEPLDGETARELEPALAPEITRGFRVPDAVIDPFRLTVATAAAAERAGARIEPHATVTDLRTAGDRVVGAVVEHADGPGKARSSVATGPDEPVPSGTRETIRAAHTVNAAGAWADQIAALAGHEVGVRPTRGVMTVTTHDQTSRVCNRCRPKTDGDILVPAANGAVLGTTSVPVENPDDYPQEDWEQRLVIDELAELVPAVADASVRESYWGVRPLYEPVGNADATATTADATATTDDATATTDDASAAASGASATANGASEPTNGASTARGFAVLEHTEGLTTVVGGKLTTHRLMAQQVGNRVADALGIDRESDTASVPLVGVDEPLDPYLDAFGCSPPETRRLPPTPENRM